MTLKARWLAWAVLLAPLAAVPLAVPEAWATGIFNTVHFVDPGKMGIGVEPEIDLNNQAGVAGTVKYTQGISDFMDAAAFVGTGSGYQRFRVGGDLVFDFFPDVDQQPGIGLLTRTVYYRLPNDGELDLLGSPYIHKSFVMDGAKDIIDPYLAVPMGMGFNSGTYHWLGQLVIGSMFKNANMDKLWYSAEVGIDLNNSESYFSGGITYYP